MLLGKGDLLIISTHISPFSHPRTDELRSGGGKQPQQKSRAEVLTVKLAPGQLHQHHRELASNANSPLRVEPSNLF